MTHYIKWFDNPSDEVEVGYLDDNDPSKDWQVRFDKREVMEMLVDEIDR